MASLQMQQERPKKRRSTARNSPSRISSTIDRMSWNTWKAWLATASSSAPQRKPHRMAGIVAVPTWEGVRAALRAGRQPREPLARDRAS